LIKRPTQVMKLFKPWPYVGVAALLAIVILLCVGAFLLLPPTGPAVPAALTPAASPNCPLWASGNVHPLDGSYPAVPLEEAEGVDKHPVNADLLTALVLLAVSYGAAVVWLLTNGRGRGAFRSLGIDRCGWFLCALEDRLFLVVFRL
jgi:hypothetical protein